MRHHIGWQKSPDVSIWTFADTDVWDTVLDGKKRPNVSIRTFAGVLRHNIKSDLDTADVTEACKSTEQLQ